MATSTTTTGTGGKTARRTSIGTDTASDIEAKINQIRADISSLAGHIGELGSTAADGAKGQAMSVKSDVLDASERALQDLRAQLSTLETDLRRHVRDKPLQTLGIAAGIGFLAAILLRR